MASNFDPKMNPMKREYLEIKTEDIYENSNLIAEQSPMHPPPKTDDTLNATDKKSNLVNQSYFLMFLSSVFAGLGNSLEPISMFVWLHLLLLVLSFDIFFHVLIIKHLEFEHLQYLYNIPNNWFIFMSEMSYFIGYTMFVQSLGFCLGFSTIAGYPANTFSTVFLSFLLGVIYWFIYCMFVFVPYFLYQRRYSYTRLHALTNDVADFHLVSAESDKFAKNRNFHSERAPLVGESQNKPKHTNITQYFVIPILFTATSHMIIGKYISSFFLISNAVLDFSPLKSLASIFGLTGITFFTVLIPTLFVFQYLNKNGVNRVLRHIQVLLIILLALSGYVLQSVLFYQRDVANLVTENVAASCVFGQTIPYLNPNQPVSQSDTDDYLTANNKIRRRAASHDADTDPIASLHKYRHHRSSKSSKGSSSSTESDSDSDSNNNNMNTTTADFDMLLEATRARVRAGDTFVMWSETAVSVASDEDEVELIEQMRVMFEAESMYAFLKKLKQDEDEELEEDYEEDEREVATGSRSSNSRHTANNTTSVTGSSKYSKLQRLMLRRLAQHRNNNSNNNRKINRRKLDDTEDKNTASVSTSAPDSMRVSDERFLGITYQKLHQILTPIGLYSGSNSNNTSGRHHSNNNNRARRVHRHDYVSNHFVLLTSYYEETVRIESADVSTSSFSATSSANEILNRRVLNTNTTAETAVLLEARNRKKTKKSHPSWLPGVFKTQVVWNYQKAHPVPVIEADVVAGHNKLPLYESHTLGTLGGAICFDMDFPYFLAQAGA